MPQFQVKKVVAVCFLEAAKGTLEQLGSYRLELSQAGQNAPADLARVYGDVRRLRDYLQRCASGPAESVDLDLTPQDATVLVASCRHAVAALDSRLAQGDVAAQDRDWLQKKQQVLAHWAMEMATKPLLELPGQRHAKPLGEATRALTTRLLQKLHGSMQERLVAPPSSGAVSRMAGLRSFGDEVSEMTPPPAEAGDGDGWNFTLSTSAPTAQPPRPAAPTARLDDAEPAPKAGRASDGDTTLFDHSLICDPRLRAIIAVDLRSYARAVTAGDHRVATVLLAAVLEGAVIDHALPRRAELGLVGTPDTWNLEDVLSASLGSAANPRDRALGFHLFAARNLLRPCLQLKNPTVVAPQSFEVLRDFVRRALHGLGYGAKIDTLPPGALNVHDILGNRP